MPRILAPDEPRGPGQVISLPRPREVGAVPIGLGAFGQALSQSGNMLLHHTIEQERAAARTKLELAAVQQLGALENEVDTAGTASEGRALWEQRFPKVVKGLQKQANDLGVPEFSGDMELLARRSEISTRGALAKRMSREGVDDFNNLLGAYQDRLAGARTQADFVGLRGELQRSAVHVAQTNPLVSPAEAERLYRATLQQGATRRATALVKGAVGNRETLRDLQASLLDENQHPDLPLDARTELAGLAAQLDEQAADRAWQQHSRAEAMSAEALEKTQTQTARTLMRRLSAGNNVTDQELLYLGAEGALNPAMINALQGWRDEGAQDDPDLTAYLEDSLMSEIGALDPAVVAERLRTGAYPPERAFSLLDSSATAWRQGGLQRLDRVKEAERTIMNTVLGVVGDDYNSLVKALDEAGDAEKRLAMNLIAQYRNQVDSAQAQVESGELNPRDFDPFPLAADILAQNFEKQVRPKMVPVPGPFTAEMERYTNLDESGLEQFLSDLRENLATGNWSRVEQQQINDQIYAVQAHLDKLRSFENSLKSIELLRRNREAR